MTTERKPTIFEMKVYDAVGQIPRGKVATYRDVAQVVGVASAQAIGQALKRNPFAPAVPCHRVVSSTGKTGGFFGESSGPQVETKQRILENEGVCFHDGRIDLTRFAHIF